MELTPATPAPAAPDPNKITWKQVGTWLGGLALSALATYTATRPATVPAPVPPAIVAPAPQNTPTTATTPANTPAPVLRGPDWQPAPQCHDYTGPVTLKVGTLTIEAATVELKGNVQVNIPEIKVPPVPTFTVEVDIPKVVQDALTKPTPPPVVNISPRPEDYVLQPGMVWAQYGGFPVQIPDPAKRNDVIDAQRMPEPTVPTPPKATPAPVRVWPKTKEEPQK